MFKNTFRSYVKFEDYFGKGFDKVQIDPVINSTLFAYIMSEQFVEVGEYGGGVFAPSWDVEYNRRHEPEYQMHQKRYSEFFREMVLQADYFDYWRQLYGPFDEIQVNVNRIKKGSGLRWHWDGYDGTFMQLLLYPMTENFGPEDGGQIEFATVDRLNPNFEFKPLPHFFPEEKLDTYSPDAQFVNHTSFTPRNDYMVVMNNMDPRFIHRVNKVSDNCEKIRHTVVVHLGFKHNWKNNKLISGYYIDPRDNETYTVL